MDSSIKLKFGVLKKEKKERKKKVEFVKLLAVVLSDEFWKEKVTNFSSDHR